MTKREMARAIAEESGIPQVQALAVVQWVFDGIVETLVSKGRIELRNFGVFEVRRRKPRMARNPHAGEGLVVPGRLVVTFKPGRAMAGRVRRLKNEAPAGDQAV